MHEDEFCLDPTRMTLVCGTAGYDGTQFKKLMADDYDIQFNKTSRNSVLLQSLAYGSLVRDYELYVADPTKGGADFRFAEPYALAFTAPEFEAAAKLKGVYAEVVRLRDEYQRLTASEPYQGGTTPLPEPA